MTATRDPGIESRVARGRVSRPGPGRGRAGAYIVGRPAIMSRTRAAVPGATSFSTR